MTLASPARIRLPLAWAALAVSATAQVQPGGRPQVAVDIPDGVPFQVEAFDFENTDWQPRGGALVIELEGSVRFRQLGPQTVRALTLAVDAHDRMLGGRASVSIPSLHAATGDAIEVYVSLRMLRPLPGPPGPAVRIAPDAVLYDSLAAAGPNRLGSVRAMIARELEARRDRAYFRAQLEAGGRDALVSAMQASLRRQAARPRLQVSLARDGPATAGARPRTLALAFLPDADAPLILEQGTALVTGSVSDAPRIRLRNRSAQAVRHFELGWLVRDESGVLYSAGAAPVDGAPSLRPGSVFVTSASRRFALRPAGTRRAAAWTGMSAYLRSAELADGSVWIPSRSALAASELLDSVPVSAEEERLSRLYRERGPAAVSAELDRFAPQGSPEPLR